MTHAFVDLRRVTAGRNLLVLAAVPGDESLYCGELIAQASFGGRPPFVAVLTDGVGLERPGVGGETDDQLARRRARETVAAVSTLGVPDEWFALLGLHGGSLAPGGERFGRIVEALSMILWRRDCNLIAVPWAADTRPDYSAAHALGAALAARDEIGCITYRTKFGDAAEPPLRLASGPATRLKARALSVHADLPDDFQEGYYTH